MRIEPEVGVLVICDCGCGEGGRVLTIDRDSGDMTFITFHGGMSIDWGIGVMNVLTIEQLEDRWSAL
jgi:hypothetical protein